MKKLRENLQKQTDSKTHTKNLQFEKQELKRKMKFHGVKNIEKKIRLY